MRNDQLKARMNQAGTSATRLAAEVGVDAKTVERWVGGRVPRVRHRALVASLLSCSPADLWPEETPAHPEAGAHVSSEVVAIYPTRRAVSFDTWRSLMSGTNREFALLAFAATFMADQVMDMNVELIGLADRGVRVRLLLGDPEGTAVGIRAVEEGAAGLAGRVGLVLAYIADAVRHPGVEVRLHDHTLYNSLYQFDDDVLVNPHIWGSPAGNNPVLHLRRQSDQPLATAWLSGFERVWDQARPIDEIPPIRSTEEARTA